MIRSQLIPGLAFAALAGVFAGCHTDSEPTPTVHFVTPAMNDTVGPDVLVKLAVTNFKFSAGAAEKSSAAAHEEADVTGHIHLFLDMPIGLDADAVEQLSKADTVTLKGLKPGKHYLLAQGAEAGHDDIDGMVDSVAFTVVVP